MKPSFPSYISNVCKSLLEKLLEKNPHRRLGSQEDFSDIKTNSWFSDVNWTKMNKR